ncbi:sugar ABC transporter substrate-binding protein [Paenibacillus sp. YSY-4.3]
MKRKLLLLLICIVVLAGCNGIGATSTKKETNTLKLYTFNQNNERADVIQNVLDQFHSQHPEIKVEMISINEEEEQLKKLDELYEGNEQVDLLWLPSSIGISEVAISKYVESLEGYADSLSLSDYYVNLDNLRYDGELYALPFIYEHYLVYFNKDMFDQFQLSYPAMGWSYNDFASIAEKLTNSSAGTVGIENGPMLYYTIGGAYSGSTFKEGETQLALDEEAALQGYEMLTNLFKNGKIDGRIGETLSDGFSVNPSFRDGTAGMMINSSALLTSTFEKVPNIGVVSFPRGDQSQQGISTLEPIAVSTKSNFTKEAIEVLKYLSSSTEARELMVRSGVTLPTFSDEKVFTAFENLFADPSFTETVREILNNNKDSLGLAPPTPGYFNVLMKLTAIFMDPGYSLYSGDMEIRGEFQQQIKSINEQWMIEQQQQSIRIMD